jgi:putative glycosyltransferase (TIGR04372 family)
MNSRIYRLRFELSRIRKLPINIMVRKAVLKFTGFILGAALLPVTAIFHFLGYRHVNIFTDRIGHLALEPDCLLKEQALGQIPRRKWIMLAPPNRIANEHMLTYWEPYFTVIRSGLVCYLISSMTRFGLMRHDIGHYIRRIGKAQDAYRIYADWSERQPLLELNAEDKQWGELMLRRLGLPDGAWFVCVHAREEGFSTVDETIHSYRNSRIENMTPSMQEIIYKGGWIIRIGDPTMRSLPEMDKVIDYAHHPAKSDRLDIILCANARFLLGNTSGIAFVSTVFRIPCALSNMIPLGGALGFNAFDISIPKLIRRQSSNTVLTIEDALGSEISNYQFAQQYEAAGLVIEENSAEDIRHLTLEMLHQIENGILEKKSHDVTLIRIHALITKTHYAYKSRAKFSKNFLQNHPELIKSIETTVSG